MYKGPGKGQLNTALLPRAHGLLVQRVSQSVCQRKAQTQKKGFFHNRRLRDLSQSRNKKHFLQRRGLIQRPAARQCAKSEGPWNTRSPVGRLLQALPSAQSSADKEIENSKSQWGQNTAFQTQRPNTQMSARLCHHAQGL